MVTNLEPPVLVPDGGPGFQPAPTLSDWNATSSAEQWPKLAECPACDSARIRSFKVIRHIRHSRCRDCGFTFANPYPPDDVRGAFYNSPFYENYRILEERRQRTDRFFSMSMYTDPRRLAQLVASCEPAHVLDFGCGTGAFLALLREEFGIGGVEGLDIGAVAREYAARSYGLRVVSNSAELSFPTYDMVLLMEVVEHVPDPSVLLKQVADLVRPGGHVLITTPSVEGILGRYLPRHCLHYTAPSHVSLFTTDSLTKLLDRHGFTPVQTVTDPENGVVRSLAGASLFTLDFASPTGDGDSSDALYRPTRLGRLLGRRDARSLPSGGRPLRFVDRVFSKVLHRSDHLYVLARRR